MRFPVTRRVGWLVVLGLSAGLLLVRADGSPSPGADQAAEGFAPVAPAPALQTALQFNLKIVRDWLDQKDYLSAAQSTNTLLPLVQLYSYQSAQPGWRDRTTALGGALNRLLTAARAKDGPGCQKAFQECESIAADLAKDPPAGERAADSTFKPTGVLRTWMLLMDGTYADAKAADNVKEVEHLAHAIAEEANAAQFLRAEAPWRQNAVNVRQAALQAATVAQGGDLGKAREALKGIYKHCQTCHETFKR